MSTKTPNPTDAGDHTARDASVGELLRATFIQCATVVNRRVPFFATTRSLSPCGGFEDDHLSASVIDGQDELRQDVGPDRQLYWRVHCRIDS